MRSFVFLILFILIATSHAIYDPVSYVSEQTYMLAEGEYIEGYTEILLSETEYYVLKVYSGKEHIGYIALDKYEKVAIEDEITLKKLFQTAYFLDKYSEFKNKFSGSTLTWFPSQYAYVNDISQAIDTEQYELELIAQVVESDDALRYINELKIDLSKLKQNLEDFRAFCSKASQTEASFLEAPEAGKELVVKEEMLKCYDALLETVDIKRTYLSSLAKLRGEISKQQNLSLEEKKSLQKTAEPPEELSYIERWYRSAMDSHFEGNLTNIYADSVRKSMGFVIFNKNRIARDICMKKIYSKIEDIEKTTNGDASTLEELYSLISDDRYYVLWKNREALSKFRKYYKNVLTAAEKSDYENCIDYAEKAQKYGLDVYRDGLIDTNDNTEYTQHLPFLAAALFIILILLFLISKHKEEEYE